MGEIREEIMKNIKWHLSWASRVERVLSTNGVERIFFFPGRKYSTVKDKSKESIGHAWGERKEKLGEYRRMMMEKYGKNETDPNISSLEAWDQTLR